MDTLFLKLLNLGMTAGWFVLAVLVLRLIFRKAPRWIFCLLWGLVALRLVLPFSLESALSLIPSAQPIPADIVYQSAPAIDSGIPVVNQVVNPVISTTFAPAPTASVNPLQVVTTVAAWVWLIGLAAMVAYSVVSYILLKRRVRTATIFRDNIRQCETVDSPFVLGLFRPTIYLPYSLSETDMDHVIAHEQTHIRRGDHWWKPLGFLLLAVYWFNPLIWVAYILFCRDMELTCDEKVVANLEQDDRRAYSTALLNCSIRRRSIAACPLAFGEVGVKSRVKSVMHYKKPAFWVVLIAIVACIVVAVCFLTVPKEDSPHTLEITGLPAPKSGEDPYENLEPAERAAAFLSNADKLSYELDPFRMHGTTLVPVLEYVPRTIEIQNDTQSQKMIIDSSQAMLDRLHGFDLSTLKPLEIEEYSPDHIESAVIHVGDARCRMTIWYEQESDGGFVPTGPLVFTFADGTMCAFSDDSQGELLEPLHSAIGMTNSGLGFALQEDQSPWGSAVTVTELATGESKNMNASAAAYVECVFENTPLLSDPVKSEAEFPWKIEILNGGTYWYNPEQKLMMSEGNKVYSIGGFEKITSNEQIPSWGATLDLTLPASILTPFGYQVSGDFTSGTVTITPPASDENLNATTPDITEPEPEPTPGIPAPKGGADPYVDLEPAERATAFLKNADNMSYEFYIMMYGEYIAAAMENRPYTVQSPNSDSIHTFDHTNQILNALHTVDLSSLRQMNMDEIQAFDIQASDSGLIHVGDARCRASVWINQTTVKLGEAYTAALVFTFTDGTVCAFEEPTPAGEVGANSSRLLNAISTAGHQKPYALYGTGGKVIVTQLSTGQIGETSAYGAAFITSVFENTPRLAPKADKENGQFDYRVTLEDGSVYLFDEKNLLLKTEAGQIYPIGGFEKNENFLKTAEQLLCNFLTRSFQETTE